ncbi:MAG: excalibur calcium-binding domain-containing protein [Pseudomonadota bacterium]
MLVISLPVVTVSVAVSVYLRTSPFESDQALLHLVALQGCEAAFSVGLAPARHGQPGYHARNDLDGDGIACEVEATASLPQQVPAQKPAHRRVGSAKFVRP